MMFLKRSRLAAVAQKDLGKERVNLSFSARLHAKHFLVIFFRSSCASLLHAIK